MRKLILGSLGALLAGAGLAMAEPPARSLMSPTLKVVSNETPGSDPVVVAAPPQMVPATANVDGNLVPMGPGGTSGWGPDVSVGNTYSLWFSAEYLLWWYKKNNLPPLLTIGPAGSNGLPGSPGVRTIGGSQLDDNEHSGFRATLGGWFTEFQDFGIDGTFFFLESKSFNFGAAGGNNQVVARPFFDLIRGSEAVRTISNPGIQSGSALGSTFGACNGSSRLYGAEFNFLFNLCQTCDYRVDLLVGYRHLSLEDSFQIRDFTSNAAGAVSLTDSFDTRTRFNGGQLGLRAQWKYDRLAFQVHGRVAAGSNDGSVNINGTTTLFTNATRSLGFPGGLFASPATLGRFSCEKFSVVPEVGLKFSAQLIDCIQVFAGYNFLYWSDVVRSGENINRNVNLLETPLFLGAPSTAPRQGVTVRGTDFWAHGLSAGFELRY